MSKLLDAVQAEDKRETLVQLRDKIAETIESCESGRDMAALSKRLMEVIDEIEAVDEETAPAASALDKAIEEFGG